MSTIADMMVKVGADTNDFNKKIDAMQAKTKAIGSKMQSVGEGLSKASTLPLAGLATAGFAAANDLDKAYSTIRAGTGATGETLEELKGNFKNVFEKVPESAGEVATALADLNTRTGATGSDLEALTEQFLTLGRVSGEDVPTLIASGTRAFGDWGIAAEDQAKTMDYFWKVSQNTGIGVTDLMNKVVQFGAPLRQMGFDFETSAALLGKFEKEGVNSELVMGSMRQALGKMAKEGIGAEEGLKKTIKAVENAGSTSEANAIAMELFGARAGPDMAAAIREGRFSVEELLGAIEGSGETIAKAGEDTETFGEKFAKLKNKTQTALEPLGIILLQLAEQWLPKVIAVVEKLANWFAGLSPVMQKVTVVIGAIAAAIGPFLVILSTLISAVATLIPYIKMLAPVFAGIPAPVVAVIAAIAALVAIFTYLWQTNDTFRTKIIEIWESIKAKAVEIFGYLKEFWNTWGTEIIAVLSTAFLFLKESLFAIWNSIKEAAVIVFQALSTFWQTWGTEIIAFFVTVFQGLVEVLSIVWNGLVAIAVTIFDGLKQFWSVWGDEIMAFLVNAWTVISETLTTIFTVLSTVAMTIFNALKAFWEEWGSTIILILSNAWNIIKTTIEIVMGIIQNVIGLILDIISGDWSSAWDRIKEIGSLAWNWILTTSQSIFESLKAVLSTIWENIKSKISEKVEDLKNKVRDKFQDMKDKITEKMNDAWDSIVDIWDSVVEFFEGIDLVQIGKDILNGLIDGIANKASDLYAKAEEIAGKVVDKFKGIFDINSPSRVFRYIGEMNGDGLELGMSKSINSIKNMANRVAEAAIPKMQKFTGNNALSKYFNAILEDGDYLNDWVTHLPKSIQGAVKGVGQQFADMNTNDKAIASSSSGDQYFTLNYNGSASKEDAESFFNTFQSMLVDSTKKQNKLRGIRR